jgi:hypothetical protein
MRTVILAAAGAAALFSTSALTQQPSQGTAIPDFSGIWAHLTWPDVEPPPAGPGPVRNTSHRNGVSNIDQLVGDYTNPILKPSAAQMVSARRRDLSDPEQPVLARRGAIHFLEYRNADAPAAGQSHDSLLQRS